MAVKITETVNAFSMYGHNFYATSVPEYLLATPVQDVIWDLLTVGLYLYVLYCHFCIRNDQDCV